MTKTQQKQGFLLVGWVAEWTIAAVLKTKSQLSDLQSMLVFLGLLHFLAK